MDAKNDILIQNISKLCKDKGISLNKVLVESGAGARLVANARKGSSPSFKSIEKIADYFGVSTDFLLGKSATPDPFIPITGSVPVLGVIRAGLPLLADEHIIGYELTDVKNPEEYFYLLVEGDSMIGAGIKQGSKVLVHKQSCADSNQIVVCRINGGDATLKRFRQQGNTVVLLPENSAYEPIIIPYSDFESGEAEIIGVAKRVMNDL